MRELYGRLRRFGRHADHRALDVREGLDVGVRAHEALDLLFAGTGLRGRHRLRLSRDASPSRRSRRDGRAAAGQVLGSSHRRLDGLPGVLPLRAVGRHFGGRVVGRALLALYFILGVRLERRPLVVGGCRTNPAARLQCSRLLRVVVPGLQQCKTRQCSRSRAVRPRIRLVAVDGPAVVDARQEGIRVQVGFGALLGRESAGQIAHTRGS